MEFKDFVLVVDRSLVYPNNPWGFYDSRNRVVAEIDRSIPLRTDAIIAYSDVARVVSSADAQAPGPDVVYGANLQHALRLARTTALDAQLSRILLVTYNLPSAHHIGGDPFFMYPPIPESLEAGRIEARLCADDSLRINALLIADDADRSGELDDYFRPLTQEAGGDLVTVAPGTEANGVAIVAATGL